MKFSKFSSFQGHGSLTGVIQYLFGSLKRILSELNQGLTKLTHSDNHECTHPNNNSQVKDILIAANTEVAISHDLNKIPSGYSIIKCTGIRDIIDGTTEWTRTTIYLKNANGSTASTISVIIWP